MLTRVVNGASLSELLRFQPESPFDGRDQGFIKSLCFDVCRWYYRFDALLGVLLQKPLRRRDTDIRMLLMTGFAQLEMGVPEHAAVAATVEASRLLGKKTTAGMVNAVLRRFARERSALLAQVDKAEVAKYALPEWIVASLRRDWPDDWTQVASAMLQRPPMSLRINRRRTTVKDYLERLNGLGIKAQASELSLDGIEMSEAVAVDELPGFRDGDVSVQDSGAQIAAALLEPRPGERVLDACAAPGGKTGHLLEIAHSRIELVAIDSAAQRLQRVEENLDRLGFKATVRQQDLAADDLAGLPLFDAILLDAPCSALGVVRRHPDIRLLRKAGDIEALAKLQRAILDNCWRYLKPGGRLLYSTCSLLRRENSEQIEKFVNTHNDARLMDIEVPSARRLDYGVQLLPCDGHWDGFFYALLVKD